MSRLLAMLRTRQVWPVVEAELISLGVSYRLERGGKHPVVRICVDGQERRLPIAGSPRSRGQAVRKSVCQIRRVVAQLRETSHG